VAALAGPAGADVALNWDLNAFQYYHDPGYGPFTPNHIWVTGDFWADQFDGTGLPQACTMSMDLLIDDNILSQGQSVNLDVLLNSTLVGNFSIPSGLTGLQTFNFAPFAAVAGSNYSLKLLETNTIPGGYGSVSMTPRGSTLTLGCPNQPIPDAASLSLALCGFATLGGLFARRKR
jgi:hypothetical protein